MPDRTTGDLRKSATITDGKTGLKAVIADLRAAGHAVKPAVGLGGWVGRLVVSKAVGLVAMVAATEAINLIGGDDRSALVIGGIVWGYLLHRWRII